MKFNLWLTIYGEDTNKSFTQKTTTSPIEAKDLKDMLEKLYVNFPSPLLGLRITGIRVEELLDA